MNNNKLTDKNIAEFLKENLPTERKDEWFVRKTMNRLPERRLRLFSGWEIASFVLSFIVLTIMLVRQLTGLYTNPVIQISDYIFLCLITFGYVFLTFSVVMPVVRRG